MPHSEDRDFVGSVRVVGHCVALLGLAQRAGKDSQYFSTLVHCMQDFLGEKNLAQEQATYFIFRADNHKKRRSLPFQIAKQRRSLG